VVKEEKLIVAGSGGQGVLLAGSLLTYAAMLENKEVCWLSSYGPEMRGGTANCTVVISEQEIYSPIIEEADTIIVFNEPSLQKFKSILQSNGLIVWNKNLIHLEVFAETILANAGIEADSIANQLNPRVMNMVMVGAYARLKGIVSVESLIKSLDAVIPPHRHNLIGINEKAVREGAKAVS